MATKWSDPKTVQHIQARANSVKSDVEKMFNTFYWKYEAEKFIEKISDGVHYVISIDVGLGMDKYLHVQIHLPPTATGVQFVTATSNNNKETLLRPLK